MFSPVAQRTRGSSRGFTLIELLVVMGIIALLMAILVPTLSKIREQVKIAHVTATITGISQALDTYKRNHLQYAPDDHSDLLRSSQCLVYYLSGGSIYYVSGESPDEYPWQHSLYHTVADSSAGRKSWTSYYEFNKSQLKNFGDDAPALIDPWGKPFIYNCGGGRYGSPKHRIGDFDLFSAGPDGIYGTEDDIANWSDHLAWGYDSFGLNDGTH